MKPIVTYHCEEPGCRNTFEIEQGNRRRYCDTHIVKRVQAGGKKGKNLKVKLP